MSMTKWLYNFHLDPLWDDDYGFDTAAVRSLRPVS